MIDDAKASTHPTQIRRILSLDGGGIMGTLQASFLAELEDDLDQPIGSYFDLIAGTSTGGILALGLGLGIPARELLDLYVKRGPHIFGGADGGLVGRVKAISRSALQLVGPKHDSEKLKAELTPVLQDHRIGDSRARLLIPAWDADHRSVYIFKTAHHERLKTDYRRTMLDAAMSTAAAPTYFRRHRTADAAGLLDGGVWSNNPIALAVVEAMTLLGWPASDLRILSLGCINEVYSLGEAPGIGALAGDVVRLFTDGQSRGALGMAKLLTGHEYEREAIFRVCPDAPKGHFKLDDTSRIEQLRGMGTSAARRERVRLEKVFFQSPAPEFVPTYPVKG